MALIGAFRNRSAVRVVVAAMAIAVVTAACTSAGENLQQASATLDGGEGSSSPVSVVSRSDVVGKAAEEEEHGSGSEADSVAVIAEDSSIAFQATEVNELIALQNQMQEVLLTIEQVEGRKRYLDSRTDFATLTVGLTEVPGGPVAAPVEPVPTDPGTIERAFAQAGEVLLATVAFIIVAAAVAIPIGILVLMVYGVLRVVLATTRRREKLAEG